MVHSQAVHHISPSASLVLHKLLYLFCHYREPAVLKSYPAVLKSQNVVTSISSVIMANVVSALLRLPNSLIFSASFLSLKVIFQFSGPISPGLGEAVILIIREFVLSSTVLLLLVLRVFIDVCILLHLLTPFSLSVPNCEGIPTLSRFWLHQDIWVQVVLLLRLINPDLNSLLI